MNAGRDDLRPIAGARDGRSSATGPASKEMLRIQIYVAMALADALAIVLGFIAGNLVGYGDPLASPGVNFGLMMLPIYFGIALNSAAYGIPVLADCRLGVARALASLLFTAAAVIFCAFLLRAGVQTSGLAWGFACIVAAFLIAIGRKLVAVVADRACGGSPLSQVLIVDGVSVPSRDGAYVVHAREFGLRPETSDPMMLDRIGRLVKGADRVVVACRSDSRSAWATVLKGAGLSGEVVAEEIDDLGAIGTSRFGGLPTMVVAAGPLGSSERVLKRLLDIVVSLLALVVLGPVMLIVATAIKLDSPGPALFVQERLGRGNRLFRIYKFRSMRVERTDGAGCQSARRDDERVTQVGRIIRRTSLDEIPQIFNVLLGDMSLVGPRPHALGSTAGDALFWEVDSRYWHRHASQPGLTGLAQVRGFRGATTCRSDLTNRLQADLEYQTSRTIWRDIWILCATLKVLVHKNAF